MKIKKITAAQKLILFLVLIGVVIFFYQYLTNQAKRSKATEDVTAVFTIDPAFSFSSLEKGQTISGDLKLTSNLGNISGVNLYIFLNKNIFSYVNSSSRLILPALTESEKDGLFDQVIAEEGNYKKVRITKVLKTTKLASSVTIKLQFKVNDNAPTERIADAVQFFPIADESGIVGPKTDGAPYRYLFPTAIKTIATVVESGGGVSSSSSAQPTTTCSRCSKLYDNMHTEWTAVDCSIDPADVALITPTFENCPTAPERIANSCQRCSKTYPEKYAWWIPETGKDCDDDPSAAVHVFYAPKADCTLSSSSSSSPESSSSSSSSVVSCVCNSESKCSVTCVDAAGASLANNYNCYNTNNCSNRYARTKGDASGDGKTCLDDYSELMNAMYGKYDELYEKRIHADFNGQGNSGLEIDNGDIRIFRANYDPNQCGQSFE